MHQQLTPRQMEIFHLMAKGLSNKEICELLGISPNTVKIHVTSILRTLDVSNRTEAVFAYTEMMQANKDTGTPNRFRLVDRLGRPAIAILPFTDLQSDNQGDYLLEGLVEELVVRLSAWQWFPIIAYASSRRFDPTEAEPKVVGQALKARYLVYGSLRRNANAVRVTVRVVDAELSQEVWSHTFNTNNDDLFDLQDEIARQIVTTMAPELIQAEALNEQVQHGADATVWDHVCRGMSFLSQHDRAGAAQALQAFDEAIAANADFSLGWHGRVLALQQQLFEQWGENPKQIVSDLVDAAERGHELTPSTSHALTDLGLANILLGKRPVALNMLSRAVNVNPSSTRALSMLAEACGMNGELDQCILYFEELLRLDPHSQSSARYRTVIGMCHSMAGRMEEGIRWSREALARDPSASGAYLAMVSAYVALGDMEQADAVVAELRQHHPEFKTSQRLAMLKPFTQPELLTRLTKNLHRAGLTE